VNARFDILLADDHVMFRRSVKRILQGIPDVKVVGEAGNGFQLLDLLKKTYQNHSPHLVIMEISMPYLRGLEATREIKILDPEIQVLILTIHKDREYLYQAFSAGASGYLLKEDADNELLKAIDTLRQGGTYISPLLYDQLADMFMELSKSDERFKAEELSYRERQILKLISEGKSCKEMAELLFISTRTVHSHRNNIMRKLSIKKTVDLVHYAIKKGYTATVLE
jgi:DNA-binding NarL/FixJ family response regulator